MRANRSFIIIYILISFSTIAALAHFIHFTLPNPTPDTTPTPPQEPQTLPRLRLLQAATSNDKLVSAAMTKIVADSNAFRSAKGFPLLTVNNNLLQIVNQWAQVLRISMTLTQYLQLYGIQNVQIENYTSIPAPHVAQVVGKLSTSLTSNGFNQIAPYYNSLSVDNYEILIVLQGGYVSNTVSYSQQQIQAAINGLASQDAAVTQPVPTAPVKQNASTPQPNVAVVNPPSTTTTPAPTSSTVQSTSQGVQVSLQVNQQPAKPILTTAQVVLIASNTTSNTSNTSSTSIIANATNTTNASEIAPAQPINQTTPQSVVKITQPVQSTNYKAPIAPVQQPSSLPLVTQTAFNRTTSFANITLTHSIPSTFLKNELFPFKGTINVPNPTGIQVNVIFTRISDQKRLAFSQYLTANSLSFQILANLNQTGDYYLSIFIGRSGFSDDTIYTVSSNPSGQIVSRPPTPPKASLSLIKNTLWLNWSATDLVQPCITQIIFTQDGGKLAQFIISNYQSQFKIPYGQFASFNAGNTSIQITQAFSSDQSAFSRTSTFSAPYNIIFNATTHNYQIIITPNSFSPIPFKVPEGGSIAITGVTNTQLENEIILLTPSKQFLSVYITGNSSTSYVQQGTAVNSVIALEETGVYILEINSGAGQAIINMPIYVGDIYPLLPDFMDLNPTYIDLPALNQPPLLTDRRALVLQLLNNVRSSFGVSSLYLDDTLNTLAQNYSQLQIQYNYVGHVDINGNSPGQRATAAGIFEGVGENLAMNNNLTNAQLMLQRSPAHLRNMVNPIWTRVGLGILQNSNQFYYLTQQFSSRDLAKYPLTQGEIQDIEQTVITYITTQYPSIKGQDKGLSSRLAAYQHMTNRPYIISYLSNLGYKNLAVSNVKVSYNNGNYMPLIRSGASLQPTSPTFTQMGITAAYVSGMLEMFAAYI